MAFLHYQYSMKRIFFLFFEFIIYNKIKSFLWLFSICVLLAPTQKFNAPYSTALFDDSNNLLGAHIAKDGQWRFMPSDSVPYKFKKCITLFEDENYYWHFGVSLKGIARAIKLNFTKNKIVSGGSTITMQVARLQRPKKARNFKEKIIEIFMAIKMELCFSKNKILNVYASNAPFGNNVVGLNAASWRYFNKNVSQLTWAENATLAVLPNAPSLIFPGKNEKLLLAKRNKLMLKLLNKNIISNAQYQLALLEPLPTKPLPLPQLAPHYLQFLNNKNAGTIYSSINFSLQKNVQAILQQNITNLGNNNIKNGAIIITDNKTGRIITYIGNKNFTENAEAQYVDCAQAARSTGSILKPFLYASALQSGQLTPQTLLPDVPMQYGSFNPKNYAKTYEGAVPANKALARSLNIPFVYLLNKYGVLKFKNQLNNLGLAHINKSGNYYGLSLILGGAEESLYNLNNAYSNLAQQLNKKTNEEEVVFENTIIFETFKAMQEVNRPDENGAWKNFENTQNIAWKTGTSFGNRDAWAIGITPAYTVSVWVGNAQGTSDNALTGFKAAAPILFSVFNILPKNKIGFAKPNAHIYKIAICHESGMRGGIYCHNIDTTELPEACMNSAVCSFHKCDESCQNRTSENLNSIFEMPTLMSKYYYGNKLIIDSSKHFIKNKFVIVYPKNESTFLITKNTSGTINEIIFDCAYLQKDKKLFWHIDHNFICTTTDVHQIKYLPQEGIHVLKIIDEEGNEEKVNFCVKGR
jgi:penicillin-binding protein 1C